MYLANLYYTTQRDVNLTLKRCDDIINSYDQSYMNQQFAERTFPVVLSTKFTNIYDKEIQELLGFYFLYFYVLDKCRSRSVYLGVCPVQFALYLRARIVRDTEFNNHVTINNSSEQFLDHLKKCECDAKVNAGGRDALPGAFLHYIARQKALLSPPSSRLARNLTIR